MSLRTVLLPAGLAGVLVVALAAAGAPAASIPDRTVRVSVARDGTQGDGASGDVALSASGRIVAFDSTATNLAPSDPNGATSDVFSVDTVTGARRLVSEAPDGTGGNGPSLLPALSGDGSRIAFQSDAANLVAGDTNGTTDVFVRDATGPVRCVSVPPGGGVANGPSGFPDISADGRYVVFVSAATNLVPGDTNRQPDIFVADLQLGTLRRLSLAEDGAQADGPSNAPAISADGSTVVFESAATNLVPGDRNGVADVFAVPVNGGRVERVSVSTSGREQNRSLAKPYVPLPDVSRDGRYVVFESDATNLSPGDINEHTDVFLHDRRHHSTRLVSASSLNVEGDNDSFAPRITADGRYVTFESYAGNLAPGDGPREDIFVRDLAQGTTSVVNTTATGAPRLPELSTQVLPRPALSDTGRVAAFASTSPNLVAGDDNGLQDVFVRLLHPPVADVVSHPAPGTSGVVRLTSDDPLATSFLCQFSGRAPFMCGREVPVKGDEGHMLTVRAGGPGMLWSRDPVSVVVNPDGRPPTVRIKLDRVTHGGLTVLRGTAGDASGIRRVEVGLTVHKPRGCDVLRSAATIRHGACATAVLLPAAGGRSWHLTLPRRVHGSVAVYARATDRMGNVSRIYVAKGRAT